MAVVDSLLGSVGTLSLVAAMRPRVVGHILLTRAQIDGDAWRVSAVRLSPVAVLLECRRQGVASRLVRAGLDEPRTLARAASWFSAIVSYYLRFGFVPLPPKASGTNIPFLWRPWFWSFGLGRSRTRAGSCDIVENSRVCGQRSV